MSEQYHIQLTEFGLQAISFVKLNENEESIGEINPEYEVYVEKTTLLLKKPFYT